MSQHGGGGLTPSDIAPARLSQQQIDELQQQYRIADVLPLTPLQQGLLFHASTAHGSDDLYAVQLDITVTGPLDPHRLRDAVHTVVNRHPNLVARFCEQFDEPVQTHPGRSGDGVAVCRHSTVAPRDVDEQIQQLCAAERAAVCDLADQPAFRAALIRTAPDRHRFVLTNHHIVLDGWSLPILLQEIFASYYGQRLPAAGAVPPVCHLAGRAGPSMPPARRGVRCWPVLTPPPWSVRQAGWGSGREASTSFQVSERDHAGPWRAGALVPHHRQHRAAGRLGAVADVADRPA